MGDGNLPQTFKGWLALVFSWAAVGVGIIAAGSLPSLGQLPYPGVWAAVMIPLIVLGLVGLAYLFWKKIIP
jgi:hypothetical protein